MGPPLCQLQVSCDLDSTELDLTSGYQAVEWGLGRPHVLSHARGEHGDAHQSEQRDARP